MTVSSTLSDLDEVAPNEVSRTQSLPTQRSRSNSAISTLSVASVDTAPTPRPSRRRSWLRNLGSKLGIESKDMASGSPEPSTLRKDSGIGDLKAVPPKSTPSQAQLDRAAKSTPEFRNPFDTNHATETAANDISFSGLNLKTRFRGLSKSSERRASTVSQESSTSRRGSVPRGQESPTKAKEHSPSMPKVPIAELVPKMKKRVAFHRDVLANDPPQLIPPLKPEMGNVIFEDSGKLQVLPRDRFMELGLTRYLDANHTDVANRASQCAHDNANQLHLQLSSKPRGGLFGIFSSEQTEEDRSVSPESMWDAEVESHVHRGSIDGTHVPTSVDHKDDASDVSSVSDDGEAEPAELTPEVLYTRCCHLREIMPIHSMLRQIKDVQAPIPELRIANTKPTMVEILTFADFLTVVPVVCVSLDNLVLTSDMVRALLSGLLRSTQVGRLTFVNTVLDELAWKYLCAFLTVNTTVRVLKLNCDFKPKSRVAKFDRKDADWSLLGQSLADRNLQVLDLSATKISAKSLREIVVPGFQRGTLLLLGNNSLDEGHMQVIYDWIVRKGSKAEGIVFDGSDLSEQWNMVHTLLCMPQLIRLSFDDCQLEFVHDPFTAEFATTSNLVHINLSLNPSFIKSTTSGLVQNLHRFKKLVRLHLDGSVFASDAMVKLCESIAYCPKLTYLSVRDNGEWTETAATALCVAVHMSSTLCTVRADTADWTEGLAQKMMEYCIENLEHTTKGLPSVHKIEAEEYTSIAKELAELTLEADKKEEWKLKKPTVERIVAMREKLRASMRELLVKKAAGEISLSDRERLIRLYYWDGSLDELFQRCALTPTLEEEHVNRMDENSLRPSVSRISSHSSIIDLKRKDLEEAEFHKLSTYLSSRSPVSMDTPELAGELLRKVIAKKSEGKSVDDVIAQLQQVHQSDLEQILS